MDSGSERSVKKGIGAWYVPGVAEALAQTQATWFYTWAFEVESLGVPPPAGVTFVPMAWTVSVAVDAGRGDGGAVLLGFNEPDVVDQSNLSVEQALDRWPALEQTGYRLASPATGGDPSVDGGWQQRFLRGAAQRGLRVDVLAVHWYGQGRDPDTELRQLEVFLRRAHATFGRPLWLTEYGLTQWGAPEPYPTWSEQAEFARRSVALLESLDFVERYAWFSLPPYRPDERETTALLARDGGWTLTGLAYRDAPLRAPPMELRDAGPGVELLAQPGFEVPGGWAFWGDVARVPSAARSGATGLRLGPTDGGGGWGWASASVARLPAGRYRARAQVRADAGVEWLSFSLHDLDFIEKTADRSSVRGAGWTALQLEVMVPADAGVQGLYVVIQAGAPVGRNVDIDDLSLVRVGP